MMLHIAEGLCDHLRELYRSGGRAYHNWAHVEEVLHRFDEVARDVGWYQPREVFLALLFHDAVYIAGMGDNEQRSAVLARQSIQQWMPREGIDVDRVADLIRATARHGFCSPDEVDSDQALFLDCDMAILGSDPEVFDAYEAAIAREYAAVEPALFRRGRRQFVERLLASDQIYLSSYFQYLLEYRARQNLRRSLSALHQG